MTCLPLSDLFRRVDCGDGAMMFIPTNELDWQLRYGDCARVRFVAADTLTSYAYLLGSEITTAEAIWRLRRLRAAHSSPPTDENAS